MGWLLCGGADLLLFVPVVVLVVFLVLYAAIRLVWDALLASVVFWGSVYFCCSCVVSGFCIVSTCLCMSNMRESCHDSLCLFIAVWVLCAHLCCSCCVCAVVVVVVVLECSIGGKRLFVQRGDNCLSLLELLQHNKE